jgi:hypothetical protein
MGKKADFNMATSTGRRRKTKKKVAMCGMCNEMWRGRFATEKDNLPGTKDKLRLTNDIQLDKN